MAVERVLYYKPGGDASARAYAKAKGINDLVRGSVEYIYLQSTDDLKRHGGVPEWLREYRPPILAIRKEQNGEVKHHLYPPKEVLNELQKISLRLMGEQDTKTKVNVQTPLSMRGQGVPSELLAGEGAFREEISLQGGKRVMNLNDSQDRFRRGQASGLQNPTDSGGRISSLPGGGLSGRGAPPSSGGGSSVNIQDLLGTR
mgnify:CR=1 FL=1